MEKVKKKITALIVDDEPLARRNIRVLLKGDADVEIIGECSNGPEAVEAIKEGPPDLLFLDIQMPEMNGFEVLENIADENMPEIIFVTAFDQYALQAFEVHALDYLLKPFDNARFEKALRQAKEEIEQKEINTINRKILSLLEDRQSQPSRTRWLSRLVVKSPGHMLIIKVDEIEWIEADSYYAKLHVGRKSYLLRETMSDLESKLDPDRFMRIHRSTIVSLDRVREVFFHQSGDSFVVMEDGTQLRLSRSRKEQLQEKFGGAAGK